MERKTKIALGLGAVALFMLWRARKSVQILGQAFKPNSNEHEPWSGIILGSGPATIGLGGCILTSITMAFNTLQNMTGENALTPDAANSIIKQAGGFVGDMMIIEKGANALGLDMPAKVANATPSSTHMAQMRALLDDTLAKGGVALLRVNHNVNMNPAGHHTILVHGKSGSGYVAADPALARDVVVDANLTSNAGTEWDTHVPYVAVGVAALFAVA